MRILYVITSVNPAGGGPSEGLRQIGPILQAKGHVVEVVSMDAPDDPWVQGYALPLHPVGPARSGYAYTPNLLPWLRAHHAEYDVVVVRGIWQFPSFAVRRALRKTKTPYFVFTHGMLDPWFKHTYPLKHLKKSLYWPWGEYPVLRDARGVCFTCEEERVLAKQSFRPYRCKEIVVNYGTAGAKGDTNEQRRAFFQQYPALENKRLFLYLSRIHEKKGCDLLIEAFAQVAQQDEALHLVMAGPDQTGWQAQLQALAKERGIEERITWPGMLSGDVKWGAFHAAEAFVLPSHQENFGIVVAEALSCSLPVLISNKVNIWREIAADKAGLVEDDTTEGTMKLLKGWLATADDEKAAMRSNARHCFVERFEIEKAADSLLAAIA